MQKYCFYLRKKVSHKMNCDDLCHMPFTNANKTFENNGILHFVHTALYTSSWGTLKKTH